MIEPSLAAFIGFPLICSRRVYMYVHGMCYLHHEVHGLDGSYNQEFWKTSGYSLKVLSS